AGGLGKITLHAVTLVVIEAEIMLGDAITLQSGPAIPLDRRGPVLLHAKAMGIDRSEADLRLAMVLGRRFEKPLQRLGVVPVDILAGGEALAELELRLRITLFGLGGQIRHLIGANRHQEKSDQASDAAATKDAHVLLLIH